MDFFTLAVRLSLSFALVGCLPVAPLREPEPYTQTQDFMLSARPFEAIEQGPLVVELTLTYLGREPVEIWGYARANAQAECIEVRAPKIWKCRSDDGASAGGLAVARQLRRNDHLTQLVFVHHRYLDVPAGPADLAFSWSVYAPPLPAACRTPLLARPVAALTVDVQPADTEQLRGLMAVYDDLWRKPNRSPGEALLAARSICWTKHDIFLPLAFELLRDCQELKSFCDFRSFVFDRAQDSEKVRTELIKYLRDNGEVEKDAEIFKVWTKNQVTLSPAEVRELLRARDPLIRASTWLTFPDQCPPGTREALMQESNEIRNYIERAEAARKLAAPRPSGPR